MKLKARRVRRWLLDRGTGVCRGESENVGRELVGRRCSLTSGSSSPGALRLQLSTVESRVSRSLWLALRTSIVDPSRAHSSRSRTPLGACLPSFARLSCPFDPVSRPLCTLDARPGGWLTSRKAQGSSTLNLPTFVHSTCFAHGGFCLLDCLPSLYPAYHLQTDTQAA